MDGRLKHIAADFTVPGRGGIKHLRILRGIDDKDYFLLYLLLVEQLGMEISYGGEKTAWTVYFDFKGHPFAVSYMKGGLLLFGRSAAKPQIAQLLDAFHLAGNVVHEIYKDEIAKRIKRGQVTIQNSTTWLLERFYFNLDLFNRIDSGSYNYREHFLKDVQLLFAFIGIVDAFFSWLEHICTLLLAVSGYSPDKDSIPKFVKQDWTAKYNRIFDPDSNPMFKRKYKELRRIRESIRNTYAHGGIRTSNSEILVHWKGVGAIPHNLSRTESYPSIKAQGFFYHYSQDIRRMTDFVSTLKNGKMSRRYRLIESGLDISFSEQSRAEMLSALTSGKRIDSYLDKECARQDAMANFET